MPGFEELLLAKETAVCCGSGGVGKTTCAAAMGAVLATRHRMRVLVVTIDPARRLADALGLAGIGNDEKQVPAEAFAAAGASPRGELWAAMLDTKQSWDDLVRRHAPDPGTRDRILGNALYQSFSGRFVQSHDYIAMERLYQIHSQGDYDLVVVDTPPTRNAIDFLEAPERMVDFMTSRFLRILIAPYRSRVVGLASRPFYQVADRILGTQFLADIAEFFVLFQTMYAGFVERAEAVSRLLRDRRTTFVVVTTLEAAPAHEAEFFLRELDRRDLPLGGLVLNRVLPEYLLDEGAADTATRMVAEAPDLARRLADLGPAPVVERVLTEVAESFLRFQQIARHEAHQRSALARTPEVVASVPWFEQDVADLAGLLRLGERVLA